MQTSRFVLAALIFTSAAGAWTASQKGSYFATDTKAPSLVVQPDAFKTLVNPMCSHCKDEAKRRSGDLKADDRVLCWTRGYSDGGVIPFRFFLSPYRVISDTYGVFVYDPDAGFARGFEPSLDFTFHGWKNGVMVMKHKDGTLYSCLTGLAFDGPKKGEKLKAVPTLVSDWGHWLDTYPQAVAYHMFDKYQPVELPTQAHAGSLKSRAGPAAKADEARVFGVAAGKDARHYPLFLLENKGLLHDAIDGKPAVILWLNHTRTAAAYRPIASPPAKVNAAPRAVTLAPVSFATKPFSDPKKGIFARPYPDAERLDRTSPFRDKETGSLWDIAGRAVSGELKGWTLEWLDGVEVKQFAWTAEHSHSTAYTENKGAEKPNAKDALKEIAGSAEFLRGVPKKFGNLKKADIAKRQVWIEFEGDKDATKWTLTPDAEIKVHGWWGRLDQVNGRVWAWFKVDRAKNPVAIFMLADDLSEQDIHGDGITVKSIDDKKIVFAFAKDKTREVPRSETKYFRHKVSVDLSELKPNDRIFLWRTERPGEIVTELFDRAHFERLRAAQKQHLRDRWLKDGLPGSIGLLHVYAGEVDVILDHEAMRWGRSLQPGAKIELAARPPINAVVKSVAAQREKTQVRLVVKSFDLAELSMGERVHLRMPAPPAESENAVNPPGIDISRTKDDRIDWFLANIYCTCPIGGDGCTGHFYTLASCNPNACGAPNMTRRYIAAKIDDGWTNREIFDALLKQRGPTMLRPHLLP